MSIEILEQIVGFGFPSSCVFTERANDVIPCERFYIVPGNTSPRWIFPENPSGTINYLMQWRPYKASSRAKWQLILAAYHSGMLGKIPGVSKIGISGFRQREWPHIASTFSSPPSPVIYIGTPGNSRKAVMALNDKGTENLSCIVKIPIGKDAGSAICQEIEMLKRLKAEKFNLAPQAFFLNSETKISTQQMIEGKASKKKFSNLHMSFLTSMRVPGSSISLRSVAQIFDQADFENSKMEKTNLNLKERIVDFLNDATEFPTVWIHGDFAPWNLKIRPNGQLVAVDWESAETNGLPLFDLIYFHSIISQLFENKFMTTGFRENINTYLIELGIPPDCWGKLVVGSLVLDFLRTEDSERKNYLWSLFPEILDTTA